MGTWRTDRLLPKTNGNRIYRLKRACAKNADLTITVTEDEAQWVKKWDCAVEVIPNVHIPRATPVPLPTQRNGLLFTKTTTLQILTQSVGYAKR